MNNFIASLAPSITRFAWILSASLLFSPAHADELKDISQMAEHGQGAAALDKVNVYIAANPKNAQALFMKGVFLAEQGRRDEAIRTFTDITEKFPNLPEPYNNLAVLYADQGQFDKARKALETAIKTHPSYATAHENLGDIYARMASEAYDKALQLDTGNTRAQSKLLMIKDIFVAGSKPAAQPTTTQPKEPVKVANVATHATETKPTETKKADATPPEKVVVDTTKTMNEALTNAVNNWSQAWASKNLDEYFASYGANFQPAQGESRKSWEAQRRERITRPSKINIELSNMSIDSVDSNNAKVRFKQQYRADGKPIRTTKTLIMKKAGDNWFIEQEIASH
ncbi:lipoprotein NlpI precursor [mine drainage metagenome]|uniref:Lipoprotein NlpI n=1 Tax=mine drainage metagenome TaxID=410659 RepID=A0A1J5RSU5_9ZZZZ